jgi:hypothetical protein
MPEMLGSFGKTFTVKAQVERACDTIAGTGVRRIRNTVVLDDVRCDGSAHAGCQAQCLVYWKEAWLQPALSNGHRPDVRADTAFARLEQFALANVHGDATTPEEPVYRCQATELLPASEQVDRWSVRSFLQEVTSGNVGIMRFLRVVAGIGGYLVVRRLGLAPKTTEPFRQQDLPDKPAASPAPSGLRPGQLVQIRPRDEIAKTLGKNGKNRGLWFDREMEPYCGRTARVKTKVERIVDERNGRLIEFKSDAYILDGVVCNSARSDGRWFCPRAIYPYWRECWVEPVESNSSSGGAQ